jgi:hypothetical protein
VNADACFEAAGFTDFGGADHDDDAWERSAAGMLDRLLAELSRFGPARLTSEPVPLRRTWRMVLTGKRWPVDLVQQLSMVMEQDHLGDCTVGFGEGGATLRAGSGHHLFWVALPEADAGGFEALARAVAGGHPLRRTDLDWTRLAS